MRVSVRALVAGVLAWGALMGGAGATAVAADPGACGRADALVAAGTLQEALDLATAVGPPCTVTVGALVDEARQTSLALSVRAAGAKDAAEMKRLATLALALDDGNDQAQSVLDGLPPAAATKPCRQADRARRAGELARAEALYTALADVDAAKGCRATGMLKLAQARERALPTRIQRFWLDDARTALAVALVAFAIGVVAAGYRRFRLVRRPFIWAWACGGLTLGVFVWWQLAATPRNATHLWPVVGLVVVLVLACLSGFLASSAARTARPIAISMGGATDAETTLAAQTVAELQRLGDSAARGVYAMTGTDVAQSGISAALDQVSNPVAKAVLAIWKAVQLGSGDRVLVTLATKSGAPTSATIALFEGRRLVRTRQVDGGDFCADRAKPTERELAQTGLDVASGIAAEVLLWKVLPAKEGASTKDAQVARLYGAREARSVALTAVAARRWNHDPDAAGLLYSRAVDVDPDNAAARFGFLSASLRTFPGETQTKARIAELDALLGALKDESPLKWRVLFNLGAAEANLAVATTKRDMGRAITHLRKLEGPFPEGGRLVDTTDRELWERLSALAEAIVLGLEPDATGKRPDPARLQELQRIPATASRGVQGAVACGFALAYARADDHFTPSRQTLSERAVDRLRLAGETPSARPQLLKDPFMRLIGQSRAFLALEAEWGPETSAFSGVDAFGTLAGEVAKVHAGAAQLLAALATPAGRSAARTTFEVDDRVLTRWAGAAGWLVARRPAERINLYQAAGFDGAQDVAVVPDDDVVASLRSAARLTGVSDLPNKKERLEMAR